MSLPGQYVEPTTQGLSTITNFSRGSGHYLAEPQESYIINKIDNKATLYLDKFLLEGYHSASWLVTSGYHEILVKVTAHRQKTPDAYIAYVLLKVDINPYSHYRLEGKVNGNTAHVWLVNTATGKAASADFFAPFSRVKASEL